MAESIDELLRMAQLSGKKKVNKAEKEVLTDAQRGILTNRMEKLLLQFKKSINSNDYNGAKLNMVDLQHVLRRLNKHNKLIECKNRLYELAIDYKDYGTAISGLESNRDVVRESTRTHLEATALLAIAHLRLGELEKAKPYIKTVLQNDKVIKTEATRTRFRKEIIERFDEEIILFSLKGNSIDTIDNQQVEQILENLLSESPTVETLYKLIGRDAPKNTKFLLFEVDKYSKSLLPANEKKLLAPPEAFMEDEPAGRSVYGSIKRVIYNSICDPNNEVYKLWFTNGIGKVPNKRMITAFVASIINPLMGFGIFATSLIVYASAILLRTGLDVICDYHKPSSLMAIRGKS